MPKELPISLEVLKVSDNKFTGGIPPEWGAFTNLKELKMEYCSLDGKALSTRTERFVFFLRFVWQIVPRAARQAASQKSSRT